MTRYFTLMMITAIAYGCQSPVAPPAPAGKPSVTRLYSKAVADSFSIFVNLPEEYDPKKAEQYPVVYLLDANLYFDIMAVTLNRYASVGLAPHVILVGIGYSDFPAMDSLRNRDDTYPVAIPEYEMSTSGGADKMLSFIHGELMPLIDRQYHTDTAKLVLMGHSLGGYFTTYALLRSLSGEATGFSGYIAASPSVHYNHYYLLEQMKKLPVKDSSPAKQKVYITFGGEENSTDSTSRPLNEVMTQLSAYISQKQSGIIIYKSDIYSQLDHMDTQLPTFIKGLQWMWAEQQK
jgi:predicted alpha/beta superfamily hydrolase